ncbi:hypothetical protein HHK36_006020 [Tetracentron sinense]|uniref:GATA-type domain-containing protein n=1 Tax=Tetracentron sinense TaxID=13715 RepID=A0A834ZGL0_TETSI|nr:hypothetical protein HHK36_006020 [Tetracentron sinense]
MTSIYLNPPSSPFPLIEVTTPSQASASSSLSCPLFFNPTHDQGGSYYRESQQHHQEEGDKSISDGRSSDHGLFTSSSLPTRENDSNIGLKLSICKSEEIDENQSDNGSVKWMSSKMRLMQKMMSSDRSSTDNPVRTTQKCQDQQQLSSPLDTEISSNNSSNNSNISIRTCSDCYTTKTPLWRSGPQGPKSLCNACGIRQRKARRAMAAAAAAESGTILATTTSSSRGKVHNKEKKLATGHVARYKKPCKLMASPSSRKKLCFEDFTISLSKNLAFHRVFPQDEKEAAILLMALSCGLVRG